MKLSRTTNRILLVVVLAAAGYLLISIPPRIVEQYKSIAEVGPVWGYLYLGAVVVGGALLAGASGWTLWTLWQGSRRKRQQRARRAKDPSQLTAKEREREMAENLAAIAELQNDAAVSGDLKTRLEPLVKQIESKREAQKLEIVAFGAISSGKSSLLNALAGRDVFASDAKGGTTTQRNEVPWPGADRVMLVDTPGLAEVDGAERGSISAAAAKNADLVLLVVDGPLRDWEFQLLARLGEMEKRVLVCLNKRDWFDPAAEASLLGQIREQVKEYVRAGDVVAVQSQPAARTRVRVLSDGAQVEEHVEAPPDIQPLAERMIQTVKRDGRDLLLANLLLQSRGLVDEARARVRESLDKRAWEIVDRYMWGAGGLAALSPFPVLDLLAGCAISSKMVVDLARVYRQDVDLDMAMKLLGELGKNLLAILGASAAAPAVTAAVGSLLKTVPGAGTIAGGVLQGLVQALVTRWIGGVFIAYFKQEGKTKQRGLAELAQREWERVTTIDELRRLVTSARSKLLEPDEVDDEE